MPSILLHKVVLKNCNFSLLNYSVIFTILILTLVSVSPGFSQEKNDLQSSEIKHVTNDSSSNLIKLLDFKNTEIKDIVRSLATKYDFNIFIDDAIRARITLRLTNLTVDQALQFIVKENDLDMAVENNIYKITPKEIPEPPPKPIAISFNDGNLTVDLKDEEISVVVRAIAEVSKNNIILNQGVAGKISGYLQGVPFDDGFSTLMNSNGFIIRKKNGIYNISRAGYVTDKNSGKPGIVYWLDVEDSLISLDVIGADLNRLIRDVSGELGKDVFIYGNIAGKVNARCSKIPFEFLLDYLFKGTNYTFRNQNGIYLIGDKSVSGIASTKLIRLNHMKVEGITSILPAEITSKATITIIKEHNGIMVVGSQDVIREVEEYVRQIDQPIAQILIEVVVVDFNLTDIGEFGITAGIKSADDTSSFLNQFFPSLDISATGDFLNKSLQYYAPGWGIKKIGKLPVDFVFRLRAMEKNGIVNIRSRPQIATLNGHPASIKIGTTQYYILETQQPIVGGNQVLNQISQRFEKITAEVSLEVIPWVSASGEITVEIHPEFSTPQGALDSKLPPTINHRILNSTVRLRDGETIVLGGLIQTVESENYDKFPILGDIPIIGRLFQNRSHNNSKSELMIYITPHLYYPDDVYKPPEGIIR